MSKMKKVLYITLIVLGVLVVAGGLVSAGVWIGHRTALVTAWAQPGYGMMNGNTYPDHGMMNDRSYGNVPGTGMMGGGRMGNGRGYGRGMMGYYGTTSAAPLTVDQAYQAAGKYVSALNNADLQIAEVMVFDNNAYVRVVEKSTGIGAFELLVDPATLAVTPEHGPNMMWNLKYGSMTHMMGGGMMGYSTGNTADPSATMTVSAGQALQDAQTWLDSNMSGAKTAEDADPFYGYYTIDILRDGKTVGMLSVNGFNGQAFLHTWHGTFIEEKDY
jgi:hypothetical protein